MKFLVRQDLEMKQKLTKFSIEIMKKSKRLHCQNLSKCLRTLKLSQLAELKRLQKIIIFYLKRKQDKPYLPKWTKQV